MTDPIRSAFNKILFGPLLVILGVFVIIEACLFVICIASTTTQIILGVIPTFLSGSFVTFMALVGLRDD